MKTLTRNAFLKKVAKINAAVVELDQLTAEEEAKREIYHSTREAWGAACTLCPDGSLWYDCPEAKEAFEVHCNASEDWKAAYTKENRKRAAVASSVKSFFATHRDGFTTSRLDSFGLVDAWKGWATPETVERFADSVEFWHDMEVREAASARRSAKLDAKLKELEEQIKADAQELAERTTEAEEEPTAGSVEQLEEERAEINENYKLSSNLVSRLNCKLFDAKREAEEASKRGDREAWAKAENEVVTLSNKLDEANTLKAQDRDELDAIENRLRYLYAQQENQPTEGATVETETEGADQDQTPNNGGELLNAEESPIIDTVRAHASKVAKVAKVAGAKVIAVGSCCIAFCVALGVWFACISLFGYGFDYLEAVGVSMAWGVRFALCVVLLFTVILDLSCWAEFNTITLLNRLNAFKGFGGLNGDAPQFRALPVSILGLMYSNLK